MKIKYLNRKYHLLPTVIAVGIVAFMANVGMQAWAQHVERKTNDKKKEETFTRPAPTRPIRPEIPAADRYRQDKIFLENADSLFKISTTDTIERQIVKGQVKFRQAGMWMFCDSAYYYPDLNSLDAFGHVRMEQGDTLFVYADKLYYEGNEKLAKLQNGPSCPKVRLINKDVTLTTDSLDYDMQIELGWYSKWGTIDDKVNTLTSLYGEYSPGTKKADFYHDVVLVNNKDGYTLLTDTLHYNTATHIALIESQTEIQGANDTIYTTRGIYDTQLGNAELLSRSILVHRDSNNNVTTLEGDSIIYDKQTSISEAYMFRAPGKRGMPMVITDTAHSTTLIGGYGMYNDKTKEALATEYPLLMEYSQSDTLFLRADTIKTYILTEWVRATGLLTKSGLPEWNNTVIVRANENGGMWLNDDFFRVMIPLVGQPLKMLSEAIVGMSGTTSQLKSRHKEKPSIPEPRNPHNVLKMDTVLRTHNTDKDISLLSNLDQQVASGSQIIDGNTEVLPDSGSFEAPMVQKEFHVALAYHRARFFKQDIQGIADSMVVVERDSMMYMFRKPVVWSGERQVTGNRIDVHFNDTTADWALIPESGMMSEYVGEDFYNQLAGKKMFAVFADQSIKTLEVSGNVETIFLPQESDSTYNRMVSAESSFLTIELDSGKMEKLKMWPEVSGTVTPLFLVKKQMQYLPQFRWWSSLRPEREWYDGRWHWNDNLGEVSDDLEQYFNAPSEFGSPTSFPAQRPVTSVAPRQLPMIQGDSITQSTDSVSSTEAVEPEILNPEGTTLKEVEENVEQMEKEKEEITKSANEEKEGATQNGGQLEKSSATRKLSNKGKNS